MSGNKSGAGYGNHGGDEGFDGQEVADSDDYRADEGIRAPDQRKHRQPGNAAQNEGSDGQAG